MRTDILDLLLDKMSDEVNLSVFTDLHFDSPECDQKSLIRDLKARSQLPNSLFLCLGDMFNAILPQDFKRYMHGENLDYAEDKDALLDNIIKRHVDKLSGYPWVLLAMGNHEHSALKSHLTNLTHRFAQHCTLPGWIAGNNSKVPAGGYSGFLRLRFWDQCRWESHRSSGPRATFDIAYTHGAWCGQNALSKAESWAGTMHGARLFLFGHNHKTESKIITWFELSQNGVLQTHNGVVAACGTYMKTYSQERTTYGEKGMHKPSFIGAPLFRLSVSQEREEGRQRARVKIVQVNEIG